MDAFRSKPTIAVNQLERCQPERFFVTIGTYRSSSRASQSYLIVWLELEEICIIQRWWVRGLSLEDEPQTHLDSALKLRNNFTAAVSVRKVWVSKRVQFLGLIGGLGGWVELREAKKTTWLYLELYQGGRVARTLARRGTSDHFEVEAALYPLGSVQL